LDWLLIVLVSNLTLPRKYVDLMLPIVFMVWRETARFKGKLSHEKIRGSVFLIDEPFYPRSLGPFLRNRGLRNSANVHLVQGNRNVSVESRR